MENNSLPTSIVLRGAFIGRFQPFHLGHLATVKYALNSVHELIIVIGSAQKSHEPRNPFTAGERIEMIRDSLQADKEISIDKIFLIPVPDIEIHGLWTRQVDLLVPRYGVIFTNDRFTRQLYIERGFKVKEPTMFRREELSATEVRTRIANGKEWKELVTFQTATIIEQIGGVERIRNLNNLGI
jgi:nicotinamide-nucleotide adenylyltransferase